MIILTLYIDDVLSLNNSAFNDYIDYIYTDDALSLNNPEFNDYIQQNFRLDNAPKLVNNLDTRLYDKCHDLYFPVVNVVHFNRNITESSAYYEVDVFVSQLICYAQVCSKYEVFLISRSIRVSKLLKIPHINL